MKLIPNTPPGNNSLLIFGAHPDDIEFGCGGIVARETGAGRNVHFVVCSRGESATHGTPEQRTFEAENGAALLGASLEFVELDGDAHLEIRTAHALQLAMLIRRLQPAIVLAPSLVENQHPDHARLGRLVRDAARLARYGGVQELSDLAPHAIGQLFYYANSLETEPAGATPVLVDVSPPEVVATWKAAMEAHASQIVARNYVELQLTRARMHGLAAGVENAIPLFPNDPIVVDSLDAVGRGARNF